MVENMEGGEMGELRKFVGEEKKDWEISRVLFRESRRKVVKKSVFLGLFAKQRASQLFRVLSLYFHNWVQRPSEIILASFIICV